MRKNISVGVACGLIFLTVALTAVLTAVVLQHRTNALLGELPEKQARFEVVDELDSIIATHYYGKNDQETLRHAIAKGYVSGLSDGVSKLLTPEEFAVYQAQNEGRMSGVGLKTTKTDSGALQVDKVYDDSPAANAGLKKDDLIVAIDAIVLDLSNSDECAAKLDNANVMTVSVTFRRKGQEDTVELEKGYEAASVTAEIYQNLGYLKISDFYASTADQVQQAVDTFTASGVQALILDVRDNASKNVENAVAVLDVFVPLNGETPAASLVDHSGETVASFSTSAGEVNLPMAVLISSATQSAAELFACDLRDFGKAQLVGSASKGDALVTQSFRLSDGDSVILPVGVMLPYKSESFHNVGLTPDVAAKEQAPSQKLSEDSQFLAAAALFLQ